MLYPMTTITKKITRTLGKEFIAINAELRQDDPHGLSDGFAITADLYQPHGTWPGEAQWRNGREADSGGAIHEEILRFAPELAPLVQVHLASPDGTPMHALANGWHFYSGAARRWEESRNESWHNRDNLTDHARAARALHIPAEDLPEGLTKEQFEDFVKGLAPRWAEQARIARELLED